MNYTYFISHIHLVIHATFILFKELYSLKFQVLLVSSRPFFQSRNYKPRLKGFYWKILKIYIACIKGKNIIHQNLSKLIWQKIHCSIKNTFSKLLFHKIYSQNHFLKNTISKYDFEIHFQSYSLKKFIFKTTFSILFSQNCFLKK